MNAERGGAVKKKRCMTEADQAAAPVPNSRAADEKLAKLAWAIAHPARLRILRILLARQACICGELVDQMTLAQSTVSQHLKILKEAGVVQGEIDGPKVCYCVDADVLQELKDLVASL
jgi:ArsR family transcriptional regulator, arsenate/arsenite/antimonite-responsive transcriptional repressor